MWTLRQLEAGDGDIEILYADMYGSPFEKALDWLKRQYSQNPSAFDWDAVTFILKDYDFGDYFISYSTELGYDTEFEKVIG